MFFFLETAIIASERCYRSDMDTVRGRRKIYYASRQNFCKDTTRDFIQSVGVYPMGACAVLEDGRSGVMADSSANPM
jgi:HD-GYP domain-containing protein (c-di-GMP phosphodiesterase class II)